MKSRDWLIDVGVGVILGGFLGVVVVIALAAFSGVERQGEAGLLELLGNNPGFAFGTVAALLGGPLLGTLLTRSLRKNRGGKPSGSERSESDF